MAVPDVTRADALAGLRRQLSRFPVQASFFEKCFPRMLAGGYSVAVQGSLATGMADRYSDLDFLLLPPGSTSVEEALRDVCAMMRRVGRPFASFRADHLGLNGLLVSYFTHRCAMVKVDVHVVSAAGRETAKAAVILHDPRGELARLLRQARTRLDVCLMHRKFCCWLWFIHAGIARGEYFHAARSIDFAREHALLPLLRESLGLPQDGHRRIEMLLPAPQLARLRKTHPRSLDRRSLSSALFALADHYGDVARALASERGVAADAGGLLRTALRLIGRRRHIGSSATTRRSACVRR